MRNSLPFTSLLAQMVVPLNILHLNYLLYFSLQKHYFAYLSMHDCGQIEFHRLEVEQQALRNEQAEIARKLREPMGGCGPKEQDEGEDDEELSDSSMEDAGGIVQRDVGRCAF